MIRRTPRSTQSRSSAASDVYKRQEAAFQRMPPLQQIRTFEIPFHLVTIDAIQSEQIRDIGQFLPRPIGRVPHRVYLHRNQVLRAVSYTHLRAHETRHDLVCRLLLEKKKKK